MSAENVETVRRVLAANRSGPLEKTLEVALLHSDPAAEFRSRVVAVEGGDYRGHAGIRQYFADMADAFRTWRNEASEIVSISDEAVLADNAFSGIGKASGAETHLRSAILFVLSEGKIVRCLSYATRAEALKAAGLSE